MVVETKFKRSLGELFQNFVVYFGKLRSWSADARGTKRHTPREIPRELNPERKTNESTTMRVIPDYDYDTVRVYHGNCYHESILYERQLSPYEPSRQNFD